MNLELYISLKMLISLLSYSLLKSKKLKYLEKVHILTGFLSKLLNTVKPQLPIYKWDNINDDKN